MIAKELSEEEEHELYNLSGIPAIISIFLIGVYFVYLMHNNLLKSIFDVVIRIGMLLAIIPPLIIFSTFELLYSRKIKKPFKFHIQRFAGRTIITLMVTSSLPAFFVALSKVRPLQTEEWNIFLYSFVVWIVVWLIIAIKFKQAINKLTKGQWSSSNLQKEY